MIYPQEIKFNWDLYSGNPYSKMKYTPKDVGMLCSIVIKICQVFSQMLGGRTDLMDNMKVLEFTDTKTPELLSNNALGLSYPDRNLNYVPANLSRLMVAPYTGIVSMEAAHNLWYRITGDWRESNDVIHWLFNENHLITYDYVSDGNFRAYGGSIPIVLPDLKYGLANRQAIMNGIRAGRFIGAPNPYWSIAEAPSVLKPVAAEEHELEHIKNFLVYGDVKGAAARLGIS